VGVLAGSDDLEDVCSAVKHTEKTAWCQTISLLRREAYLGVENLLESAFAPPSDGRDRIDGRQSFDESRHESADGRITES
jgi:hypothetical protein